MKLIFETGFLFNFKNAHTLHSGNLIYHTHDMILLAREYLKIVCDGFYCIDLKKKCY